jgi:hypothetical protein
VYLAHFLPQTPSTIQCNELLPSASCMVQVHYRVVPGLTFEMCQAGVLTPEVKAEFVAAVKYLDRVKHVHAITGDCALLLLLQTDLLLRGVSIQCDRT